MSSNGVSFYKMSVLDGTHALEFTLLDNDGRQRKAHLCLFYAEVNLYLHQILGLNLFNFRFIIVNMFKNSSTHIHRV